MVVELVEEGEKSGEYFPMDTLGRSSMDKEEDEDKVALVSSPSRKKSTSGPRKARISSRPELDVLDVSGHFVGSCIICCSL